MTTTYRAFISYSHAADERLASAVQSALHAFAKPWYRRRAMKVFRDKTSLAANPALWASIETALADAEYFVLLASPQAAQSPWVAREVDWWLQHRSVERLLLLVTGGDLAWDDAAGDFDWARTTALPAVLRGRFRQEPLFVDLRWADAPETRSLRHTRFRAAILDVAATLRGVPKDELDGEDVRQHRRTRTLAGATVAGIVVLAAAAAWQAWVATVQRGIATAQRNTALSRLLAAQSLQSATGGLSRLDLALLQGVAAYRIQPTAEARRSLATALMVTNRVTRFVHAADTLVSLAISPDLGTIATGHTGGQVVLWDAATWQPVERLTDLQGFVAGLAFSPDGKRLAAADSRQIVLWTISGHRATRRHALDAMNRLTSVAWSPDGATLYALDGGLRQWDAASGVEGASLDAGLDPDPRRLAVAADGTIATAGDSPVITLRDAAGRVRRTLRGGSPTVTSLGFSRDGARLASGGGDGTIAIWDVAAGTIRTAVERSGSPVDVVAFGPGEDILASGDRDRLVALWDAARGTLREVLPGHTNGVVQLAFGRAGTLVSAGFEATFIVWNLALPRQGHVLNGHEGPVGDLAVSPDGTRLASAGDDGTIRIWDLANGREEAVLAGHRGDVRAVAFDPASGRLASGGEDRRIRIWDTQSGEVREEIDAEGEVESLAISPDGRTLAWAAAGTPQVFLWDVAARAPRPPLAGHDTNPRSLEFSREGDVLVSAGGDTIRVWDPRSGREVEEPMGVSSAVRAVPSPDGRLVASSQTWPNAVLLWPRGGRADPIELPTGNPGSDHSPAFSPDGGRLAYSAGTAGLLLVIHVLADDTAWTIEMPASVTSLAFTPDGTRLVTGHSNGRIGLWDASVESWPARACAIANRDLTEAEWHELVGDEMPYRPICPALAAPGD